MGERLRRLVASACLLLPWGSALAARDFGVVSLELRAEGGVVPTHVCVATGAASARARHRLDGLLGAAMPGVGARPLDLGALGVVAPEAGCLTDGVEACAPQVVLPEAWSDPERVHLACAVDALATPEAAAGAPAVVVVQLEALEASPPPIDSLRVAGGVVTLGLAADVRRMTLTGRVVGGHFAAERTAVRAEASGPDELLLALPLAPRCRTVDLGLPATRVPPSAWAEATATLDGVPLDVAACLAPAPGGGRVSARLPRVAPGATGALSLRFPEALATAPQGLAAWWTGPWPSADTALQVTRFGFSWRRPDCVAPREACPAVWLPSGEACVARSTDTGCAYACPGEGGGPEEGVALPVDVALETRDEARLRWSALVRQPGDVVTSYAEGAPVPLQVDTSGWAVDVPGARVRYLELRTSDGVTRRYPVGGGGPLRVPVAGATCDPVRYRFLGDRVHEEGLAAVVDGRIEVPAPRTSARVLSFEVAALAGGSLGLSDLPDGIDGVTGRSHFTGLVQLVGRFRPRASPWSRLGVEVRLGGSLGQWGRLDGSPRTKDGERLLEIEDKPLWGRVVGDLALVVDLTPVVALGVGGSAGGGWPVASDERLRTGSAAFGGVLLDLRFQARPWVALVLQGRSWFGDRLRWTPAADADPVDLPTSTLVGLLGAQFRL